MASDRDERAPRRTSTDSPAAPALVDAAVVGGGFAGLAAALWLGRHRRRTVVLDAGHPRNRAVDAAHGYLGADGIAPDELLARARGDLARYETVAVAPARVTAITGSIGRFELVTDEGRWTARRVVLCTGLRDELPAIDGLREHWGADVAVCPACDGFEARNQPTVVIGWGEHVAGFALTLLDWVHEVAVLTGGHREAGDDAHVSALTARGIPVIDTPPVALLGPRGALEGVQLADGRRLPCHRAFVSIAHHPSNDLVAGLGCAVDEHGYVVADASGATTVDGVFAAGDCTPGTQLVQVAAAEGALAGIACAVSLRGEPPVPGAPPPGPDPEEAVEEAGGVRA